MNIIPYITITSPIDFLLELGPNSARLHGPDSEAGAETMRQKLGELGFGEAEIVYDDEPETTDNNIP